MTRRCSNCGQTYPDDVAFCGHDSAFTIQELPPDLTDTRLGTLVGNYMLTAHVADGAMGRVYEARHTETRAKVAVKILHDHVKTDLVAVERFRREAETAQSMPHPHIVQVLEFGSMQDATLFMVMEYLQGEELSKLLRKIGTVPLHRALRIVSQVGLALDHAHSFGFIHRDLKPDNIFLCHSDQGDVVKILDFGSVKLQMETGAKLTAIGTTLGSPYYMSPEQAMGKLDVDQRTDVFALGAILYEMLTGKIAFDGKNVAMILMKLVNENPVPVSQINASVSAGVDDVISKSLRKDKATRYGSTVELATALGRALGVSGSAEQWAQTPESVLFEQLSRATPAAPKPFGAPSLPPPAANPGLPAVQITPTSHPPRPQYREESDYPQASSNKRHMLWVVIAAAAVTTLCVLGGAFWLIAS